MNPAWSLDFDTVTWSVSAIDVSVWFDVDDRGGAIVVASNGVFSSIEAHEFVSKLQHGNGGHE